MERAELQTVKDTLERIAQFWFLCDPLLFACYCTHTLVENPKLTVPFRTGKMRIEYNPSLLVGKSQKLIRRLFEYEVIRILLKHPYQRRPEPFDAITAILASDITILQDEIDDDWQKEIPAENRLPRDRSFEEYYNLLMYPDSLLLKLGEDVFLEIPRRQYFIKKKYETEGGENCGYNGWTRQIGQTEEKGLEGQDSKKGKHEVEAGCDEEEGHINKNIENLPDHSEDRDGFSETAEENGSGKLVSQMEDDLKSPNGPAGLWDENDVARELINEMIREKIANLDDWGKTGSRYKEKIAASITEKYLKISVRQFLQKGKICQDSVQAAETVLSTWVQNGILLQDFYLQLIQAVL